MTSFAIINNSKVLEDYKLSKMHHEELETMSRLIMS